MHPLPPAGPRTIHPRRTLAAHTHATQIKPRELQQQMLHAVVWLDYTAFPQPSVEIYGSDEEARATESMLKAIDSIPAYVAHSSLMVVVCPPAEHAEMQGVVCHLGSWLDRACACHHEPGPSYMCSHTRSCLANSPAAAPCKLLRSLLALPWLLPMCAPTALMPTALRGS